jgi:hypothetical protein
MKKGNMNVYDLRAGVQVYQSTLSKYEPALKDVVVKQVKKHGVFLAWKAGPL